MARFFGLGPLILVLCMALCDANNGTNSTPSDSPANTSGVENNSDVFSPSLTPSHQHKPSTEVTGPSPTPTSSEIPPLHDYKNTETGLTTPANSPSPPANTSGVLIDSENKILNQTDQTSSPSLIPSHQHNTSAEVTGPLLASTPPPISQSEEPEVGSTNVTQTDQTSSPSLTPVHQHNTTVTGPLLASTPPPISQSEEPEVGSTNVTQTNQTSSPSHTPVHQHNTTDNTTLPANTSTTTSSVLLTSTTKPSTDPDDGSKCKFNATWTQNGTEVKIFNGSANVTYTVKIRETKKNVITTTKDINDNITIQINQLKPCTEYTVEVDTCLFSGNNTFYTPTDEKSVSNSMISLTDTHVCFKDGKWNLEKCVEIINEKACKNMTLNVTLDTCNYTMMAILPPAKPNITFNETIPTQFKWSNKPQHCNNTQIQVSCTGHIFSSTVDLDQDVSFSPNKTYNCIGKYHYEKETIKSEVIPVNITCGWPLNAKFDQVTAQSFNMSWNFTHNDKCRGVKLHDYTAYCSSKTEPYKTCTQNEENDIVCSIGNLKPHTIYTCKIEAKDNINNISGPTVIISTGKNKTDSDKPNFTSTIKEEPKPLHNSIKVTCGYIGKEDWNGDQGYYTATLTYEGSTIEKKNNSECSFIFNDLYYLTSYRIKVKATNQQGYSKEIESEKLSTKYNDKAVIGFLAFLIIVTSIALLFVLYKIFLLKRKRNDGGDDVIPLTQPLRNVEPILAENLVDAYKRKIADEGRLFMDEFQSIPRIFSNYTIKEAKKPDNQSKNRYVDILPYDYNRVALSNNAGHDYINASFIEGYKEPKKYIAAQGPKDETIDDFWRMIWEQKSAIIVMVTRCEEGNKSKCAQYWPYLDRETEIYEDFVVKIRSEEHCPDYIVRHLLLSNKREKASEREVTQIQFTSWPDHGVPGDPSLLLKLRRRVNSFKNFFSGPVVVHCSAGVGRTGTYIGIDAMIESLEAENRVDIYAYVAKLRRQRCLMVQVETQYILIHQALIEHNQFGETEILLSELHSQLKCLRQKDGNDPSLLELEFQKLPKFKNWRTIKTAISEENKKKNRYSSVVPYDYNRVLFRLELEPNQTSDPEDEDEYSSSEDEEESNEYINASFIDGYWCKKSLIAAQGPLPDTIAEFLRILYQQQTKILIMLTDCQEDDKDYCSKYWGDEKKVFGDMEIEVKKTESFPAYVKRHLEIQSTKKKEVLEMDQYQFLRWRNSELPENAQELIEMMRNIRENGGYDNSTKNRNIPIMVHCQNGSSRTGIFCALWNLLDSASTEKLVDVFQAVKNVRKERQRMIETYEQYQFLYAALEGAFPVQNGGIKSPASDTDSVQIINETTALLSQPASSTSTDQEEEESNAKESTEKEDTPAAVTEDTSTSPSPAEGAGEKEEASEKPSTEGTSNGPAATVDV